MTDVKIHRIGWSAFARSLNQLRAITINPPAEQLEKFKRLASYEGMSPEQYLASLMTEAIEIDESLNTPPFRIHGNRKSRTIAN